MPQRADFELIVKPLREPLKSLFGQPSQLNENYGKNFSDFNGNVDIFADLLDYSQYFHYVFLKLGTCFPIDCSPRDVQRIARLIGRRWSFQTGPVKCNSKFANDYASSSNLDDGPLQISTTRDLNAGVFIWKPHMTESQYWALIILGSIFAIIIAATLVDLLLNQIPKLRNHIEQLEEEDETSRATLHELSPLNNSANNERVVCKFGDANNNNDETDNNSSSIFVDGKINVRIGQFNTIQQQQQLNATNNSNIMLFIKDLSIYENAKSFLSVQQSPRDISCLHGIRCLTMSWIIIAHTMQYNDWSAFARAREVEVHLRSLITQPLFNGTYLVDTFFLMSGLLTSYTIFVGSKNATSLDQIRKKFSSINYLMNRYLRLTPQVLFVSGLFILLPLATSNAGSPHWYTMTGEYSEFCTRNWWLQIFQLQAFVNPAEMCNFASWWVSVDSFFHLIALFILLIIFANFKKSPATRSSRQMTSAAADAISNDNNSDSNDMSSYNSIRVRNFALGTCVLCTLFGMIIQFGFHYYFKLPPNMMSTIPQTEAMFSITTLYFFWTPMSHSIPFILGLLTGFMIAREKELIKRHLNWPRALLLWSCVIPTILLELFSTYFWIIGYWSYKPAWMASTYSVSCTLIWSLCLIWIILACKFNYAGPINSILSCNFFIILSKASYLVYLSHFLILFNFFGSQNLLLEPSQLIITYVMIGNICISMVFGSFLCVTLEMPWLRMHKRLMGKSTSTSTLAISTTSNGTQNLKRANNDTTSSHNRSVAC